MKRKQTDLLADEIWQIKQRLRYYQMHDPWCQQITDAEHQHSAFGYGPLIKIRPCNCWLVKEEN